MVMRAMRGPRGKVSVISWRTWEELDILGRCGEGVTFWVADEGGACGLVVRRIRGFDVLSMERICRGRDEVGKDGGEEQLGVSARRDLAV